MAEAAPILAKHGLTGALVNLYADRWQLRGVLGSHGVAVEIEGEPDEALIDEAAGMIAAELRK